MKKNKELEIKDKLAGTIMEAQGVLTDDKALELKGKARQAKGKAHGMVADIQNQTHDMTDKMVGTVKEKAGELTDNKALELKGKAQRAYADTDRTERILFGLGILSGMALLVGLLIFFLDDDN